MKRFILWIRKSLQTKLLLGMLIAVIVPFILTNLISFQTTSRSVERQTIELNQKMMLIVMDNLQGYLAELNRLSVSFYYDQVFMNYIRSETDEPAMISYVNRTMNQLYNSRPEIHAVRFISRSGASYIKQDLEVVGQRRVFPEITKEKSKLLDQTVNQFEVVNMAGQVLLAIHKPIVDFPKSVVLGYLTIYIGQGEIRKLIAPLTDQREYEALSFFVGQRLDALYHSSNFPIQSTEGISQQGMDHSKPSKLYAKLGEMQGMYIYVNEKYLNIPLRLVQFIPTKEIQEAARKTLWNSLVFQLVSIFFIVIISSTLAVRTIKPIKKLLQYIAQVERGNFKYRETSSRIDEVGVLEHRFHEMVTTLDDYINKEFRTKLELSTARLKMLQAQINPHFLYNALQSINTLALRHRAEEVSDKIAELGAILRYSMDIKTESVPLRLEIEHIEHYLSLQAARYKNKLAYTISCKEELLTFSVPKMILQPLVENSIIHGMETGQGSETLHIVIDRDGLLQIRVMDTGKGFDTPTMNRIREEYDKNSIQGSEQGGIGLLNVLHRLRLYYGEGFQWDITSTPYEMTIILLQIPVNSREGKGDHF